MNREPVRVPAEALAQIQDLYDQGLYLQAYHAAERIGPLKRWHEPRALTLAGRLAANLGGYRLSRAQHRQAWRADKSNPDLLAYHTYGILHKHGPLAALRLLDQYGQDTGSAPAEDRMHLATLGATVMAQLRDFRASDEWLERAARLMIDHPWFWTAKAHVLELQDRYAEALEAAQQALALRPWFRPGVQALAHALQLLDRDEEALDLLVRASARLESMNLWRQLAGLQGELGRYAEAAASLDRSIALGPLMEEGDRLWAERHRVTLDCQRRDWAGALAAARRIDEPYYRELCARLERGGPYRQVRLEVPFVRQHHLTCAPATLAAISRFWNRPAEHLEVAEAICYDGTPAHSERHWAETHGWAAREFTVTWEAAVTLLDRGVPFTLTTSNATNSHLQAVVGYDEARETLWIRDPFVYYANEFPVKALLMGQHAYGPRGMALVPAERTDLLAELDLPEADMYDRLYAVDRALVEHQREEAVRLSQALHAAAPDHRLTLHARCAVASYDGNLPALLESIELLLRQFPENQTLQLTRLRCLRDLARRKERLELLGELCEKRETDPVFWQQYAQELRTDARHRSAAAGWMRWALRYRPTDPALLATWADILWDEREFARAARVYRFAACLGDKNEAYARTYFLAELHLRQAEEVIEFLRAREARLGRQAGYPGITLVDSLQHLRRTNEALATLENALARRPDDSALHLFAADFYARLARFETAEQLLQRIQNRCPAAGWHRAAASVAAYQNRKAQALEHWREVLKPEPLAYDAIEAIALLVAETENRAAALRFLEDLSGRFPFSCPLLTLRIKWLTESGAAEVIPHLRRLLDVNPADAWAWRELALTFSLNGNLQEALDAAQEAIRVAPNSSVGYSVRGQILVQAARVAEGRADYREALRLEVDNEFALAHFVATAPTLAERKRALEVVAEELRRQVIFRDALFAYRSAARGVLPPRDVLELLQEAHRARPDLWQAWSVLVHQLVDVGEHDQALRLAQEGTERFPLHAPLWIDLARVEQARLDDPAQIAALERALEISPNDAYASRQLAAIYERQQRLSEARGTLEQAIAANPLDAVNHGCLAGVLWQLGERTRAIERAQHAIQLQPGYEWAWNALTRWGRETERPELAAESARELTRLRAGEARSWLMLASVLDPAQDEEELFAALDRAVALNPRCEEAYDTRACVLVRLNRFEEALAQCRPPALQPPPALLLIRTAWIEAERGNLSKAIALVQEALSEHPDFYGGWRLLSEWQCRAGQLKEASAAAEKMAALAPLDAVPLGYLGDLRMRLGDPAGARAAFDRAFALDPNYEYAGFSLFGLQIQAADPDAAARTLQVLRRHGENHQTFACAVELEVARKNTKAALDCFDQLCGLKDAESWSIGQAMAALEKCRRKRTARAILNRRLAAPDCTPAVAEYWVGRQAQGGHWWLHKRLAALQGQARRRAVLVYLDFLGQASERARQRQDMTEPLRFRFHLWLVLRKYAAWLKEDLECWGKVGYVLTANRRAQEAVEWLADWRDRPEVESWMLYNLFLMLQSLGRHDDCLEVIRHAGSSRHGESFYQEFRLWGAFEEALTGDAALGESHLASLPPQVKEHLKPLRAMTELALSLRRNPPLNNKEARRRLRAGLIQAFPSTPPCKFDSLIRGAYNRLVRATAAEHGRLGIWPWWFFRGRLKRH